MSSETRTETPVALVERAFEILDAGGPPALMARYEEFFTEGFEWRPALIQTVEGDRTYVGRSGFAEYWNDFTSAFSEARWEPLSVEEPAPGIVFVPAKVTGRGSASGVPFDRETAFVIEVTDGRVTAGRTFFSAAEAREFIGA
jgi:ketosteroid isomerase-like protein